ncbi:hypothetical protein DEU56DRAFT_959301 [Suillus clintonianus]|uniref:uncharacterized protein n=1 Tax=Suillus clintonianus TaxID=1904413 RepID=UPI001B85DC1A|nr:uncharacterized protein DEU56DRAFT_959301 [Suillus clintonianus]KAG2126843.1 hypothetical protein DEU56DRAFT_959301 [Suillus clintonianus]
MADVVTPKSPSGHKRVLKNKSVSPIFCSLSPTPNDYTPPKKQHLPKVVEGFFGTVLTDRLGRARPGARCESEGKQTKAWPPVRDKKGKEKLIVPEPTALASSAAEERHPVNGFESQTLRPAVVPPKREPESQRPPAPLPPDRLEPEHHPFSQIPLLPPPPHPPPESPLKHRSTNGVGHIIKSLWDRKRDNDTGPAPSMVQPASKPSKLTTAAPVVVPSSQPTSKENVLLSSAPSLAQISTGSASSTITTARQLRVPSKEEYAPTADANSIVPQQENISAPAPRRSTMQPLFTPNSPFLTFNTDKGKGKEKQRDVEPSVTHGQRLLNRTQKRHRRKTVGGYDLPRVVLRTLSAQTRFGLNLAVQNKTGSRAFLADHGSRGHRWITAAGYQSTSLT